MYQRLAKKRCKVKLISYMAVNIKRDNDGSIAIIYNLIFHVYTKYINI